MGPLNDEEWAALVKSADEIYRDLDDALKMLEAGKSEGLNYLGHAAAQALALRDVLRKYRRKGR